MDLSDSDDFGRQAVRLCGGTSLLVGIVVLLGWALDSAVIKSVLAGLPVLKVNAALGFVLLGTTLLGHRSKRSELLALSYVLAASLLVLAAATLAEHIFNHNLGIDELLIRDHLPNPSRFLQPGRMSPLAAASFFLLAVGILLSRFRSRLALWGQQLCMLVPLLVATRTLVGWLYGVPTLYPPLKMPMSLHATIAFLVVSTGLLLSRRAYCLARLFDRSSAGSAMARRILLWAIGLPLALGVFCLQGEKLGLFPGQYGLTVFVVLITLLLVIFLVVWSGLMNQLDHHRQVASAAAREFQHASERDHLTGLLNRRGFLERSEEILAQARRNGNCLACVVLDIDFFKKINDVHGHSAGDNVLRQFSLILQSCCRPGDIVGRVGGEEFCVLLPIADEDRARDVAEWLRAAISAHRFALDQTLLAVSCSGGVAELRPSHAGVHSLIDSADAALLVAKQMGRNKIVTSSSLAEGDIAESCGGPLRKVQVQDIMVPVLASLRLEATISQAASQLMELNLDSLPVVDAEGKVAGFVTEQEVMSLMLDARDRDQPLASCNHFSIATFEETVAAEEIATFFSRSSVQRVVIVRRGIPVGFVSRRTLLRWLLNYSLGQQAALGQSGGGTPSRRGLDDSIRTLADAISRLTKIDAGGCDELLTSSVVSEATRIQESVENLLTSCRPRRTNRHAPDLLTSGALSIT
jgi:diguanylate cyclase (GGDEF)-like protein